LFNLTYAKDISSLRWTVDYKEDLYFSRGVYKHLQHKKCFSMEDVLSVLARYPNLYDLQREVIRNEGYIKSIKDGD
jgi:spore coat polysaccharide biosynthesis protein SpsF (cytidylyltransferase family)